MKFDKDRLADQLFDSLATEFKGACQYMVEELSSLCESPIEILFGSAFWLVGRSCGIDVRICHTPAHEETAFSRADVILIPQYNWKQYRIDWVIKRKSTEACVFVECDGHDFHERTKEQAEHDRAKDREIQLAGIPILRFTGRELHRDAAACVVQTIEMLRSIKPKISDVALTE